MHYFSFRRTSVCAAAALFISAAAAAFPLSVTVVSASDRNASDFQAPVTLVNAFPAEMGEIDGPYPYGPYGTTAEQLSGGMGVTFDPSSKYGPFEDLYAHYIAGDDGFNPAIPAYCAQFDILLDGSASKTPSLSFDALTSQQQNAIALALAFSPDLSIPDYSEGNAGAIPKNTYLSWLGMQQLIWNIAGSDENGYTPIGSSRTTSSGSETDAADFPLLSGQALDNAGFISAETGSYDSDGIILSTYKDVAGKVISAASFASHASPLNDSHADLTQSDSYIKKVFIGKNMDPDLLQLSCPRNDVSLSYSSSDGMLTISVDPKKAAGAATTITLSHLLPDSNDSAVYFGGGGQVVVAHSPKTTLSSVVIHLSIEEPTPSITPFQLSIHKNSASDFPLSDAVFEVTYTPAGDSTLDSAKNQATKRTWYLKTGSNGTAGFHDLCTDRNSSPLFPESGGGYLIPAGKLTVREVAAPAGFTCSDKTQVLTSSGDGRSAPIAYESSGVLFTDEPAPLDSYSTNASWYSSAKGSLGKELAYADLQSAVSSGIFLSIQDTITWSGASQAMPYQMHTELFDVNHPEKIVRTWDTSYQFPSQQGSAQITFPLTADDLSSLSPNGTWQLRQALTLEGKQTAFDTSVSEQIHITSPALIKTTDRESHSMDETFQYTVTFTVPGDPAWPCQEAKLTDRLPEGVSLISGSAVLSEGRTQLADSLYAVKENFSDTDSLLLTLKKEAFADFSGHDLTLTYSARIRESAAPARKLINHVTYTSRTPVLTRSLTAETSVYTGSCSLKKENSSGSPLVGAVFQLLESDGSPYLMHRDAEPDGSIYLAESGTDGSFTFHGLADGTYLIQEIQAPGGSELLGAPFEINIKDGVLAERSPDTVINPDAPTLHAGGPGLFTLLFISAALAACAFILRRRRLM